MQECLYSYLSHFTYHSHSHAVPFIQLRIFLSLDLSRPNEYFYFAGPEGSQTLHNSTEVVILGSPFISPFTFALNLVRLWSFLVSTALPAGKLDYLDFTTTTYSMSLINTSVMLVIPCFLSFDTSCTSS